MAEISDEDLKQIKLYLGGVICIQMVVWNKEAISCNIPINFWLLLSCLQMLTQVVVKAYEIHFIDQCISRQVAMAATLKRLKVVAIVDNMCEMGQVAWVLYGLLLFYSEDNTCNWETRRSFGYIVMFLILTLGMILIFKWILKLMEVVLVLLKYIKNLIVPPLRRSDRVSLSRMLSPLQPEIFSVSEIL